MPPNTTTLFNEWYVQTRAAPMTDASKIVNDASLRSYMASRLMKGKKSGQLVIDGGTEYVDIIRLIDAATYGPYTPGQKRNLSRTETTKQITQPPRYSEAHVVYTEAEILRNNGKSQLDKFKNFRTSLDQTLATDVWNGHERDYWRRPSASDMEDKTVLPGLRYSIPAFVTENITTNKYLAPGWGAITATLMGLNPLLFEGWRSQDGRYNSSDPNGDNGIFPAFDKMVRLLGFQAPPKDQQHFEAETSMDNMLIFTNGNGVDVYKKAQRAANDRFVKSNGDPAYSAIFEGRDVIEAVSLNTEQLDEAAGVYTNQPYPDGKPRYFFLNKVHLWPWFSRGGEMSETEPKSGDATQPDVYAIYRRVWGNLWCSSRRRHGLVSPT